MPRPDLVFISHVHPDHFEPAVLKRLPPGTPVWIPADQAEKGFGLGLAGLRAVHEWESEQFHGVRLTAVPAQHSGGELGRSKDRTVATAHLSAPDLFLPLQSLAS
jgi:L-ascorbate metabolism protein UlaG (beta-lactamase superfamily)